jgi:hydrogenase nickel incorporation protein HypB
MKPTTPNEKLEANGLIALANRKDFDAAHVTAVSVAGPAGSGKTSIIEALLSRLDPKIGAAAIIANPTADREVLRVTRHGYQAVPLLTDNLMAVQVRDTLPRLDLDQLDLLLIESVYDPLSPVEFDVGHHIRIGVCSAADRDAKVAEYQLLITTSDLVLLTKTDLLPLATFNFDVFCQGVQRLKPGLDVIQTSVHRNQGIDTWLKWLEFHARSIKRNSSTPRLFHPFASWFRH